MKKYFLRLFSLFVGFLLFLTARSSSQGDSLIHALSLAKTDTLRLKLYSKIIDHLPDGQWQEYNVAYKREIDSCLKHGDFLRLPVYLHHLAVYYNNLAFDYSVKGDFQSALDFSHKSLRLHEQQKSRADAGTLYNNIGYLYSSQGNLDDALENYRYSLEISVSIRDTEGMALGYNNIGHIFQEKCMQKKKQGFSPDALKPMVDSAFYYLNRGILFHEKINDGYGLAYGKINVASFFEFKIDYWNSKEIFPDSVEYYVNLEKVIYLNIIDSVYKAIGDPHMAINAMINLSRWEEKFGNKQLAEDWARKAFELSKKHEAMRLMSRAALMLSDFYEKKNKYNEALDMFRLHISLRDTFEAKQNQQSAIQMKYRLQYEKRSATDSVKRQEEKRLVELELEQERDRKLFLYAGLALLMVFGGVMYQRFRVTRRQKEIIVQQHQLSEKQKEEISHQKWMVEEKQKEIIDSITYAKRLQHAILPSAELMNKTIGNHFVLYRPKDIVAGDFYWMHGNYNEVLLCAADSTGHGVPGSLVSIVCANALEKAKVEFGLNRPNLILDKTRELVLETFSKSGEEIKDGMDVSLLQIDRLNRKIFWSGANNSLYYFLPHDTEMKQIKGDKQAVGKTDHPMPFVLHEIPWTDGMRFYLFTDGYADQFGGEKDKKFTYKRFASILSEIQMLSDNEQKEGLEQCFLQWKGNLEQTDDVTVISVQL